MAPLHIKEWRYCEYGGRYYVCPGDSDGDGYPPSSPLSQLYPPQAPSPPRGGGTRRKIILYPLDKHSYTQTRVFKSQASRELSTKLAILFSLLLAISRPDKLRSCAKYSLIRGYKFLQVLYFCRRSATALAAHSLECFYYLLLCLQPSVPRPLVEAGILMVD